jgi:hypothetical protein
MLSRKLHFTIRFARFCTEMGLDPTDAAQLVDLAMRRARAYERETGEPGYSAAPAEARFEAHCQHVNLEWRYDGLYPTVRRASCDVWDMIPYPD